MNPAYIGATAQSSGASGALAAAARSISTSHRDVVTAEMLSEMLRTGIAPERLHAHLMVFLDETPLPLARKAIQEAGTSEVTPEAILNNLRRWALLWKTIRQVW